jgi:hypothetical protein
VALIVSALDLYGRYVAVVIALGGVLTVVVWLGTTFRSWWKAR